MKPDDPQDQDLRDAMGTLRREDERRAPAFETMWQPGGQARRKPARASAAKAFVVVAPLAAAAGLALWIVATPSRDAEPSASSSVNVAASASAAPIAAAPASGASQVESAALFPSLDLDFLLREPGVSAMARLPDFDMDPVSRRPLP